MVTAGSLCSGYGGLELAHGLPLAWHAEFDRHAATVHATHWPDLPNLGDITTADWSDVEPVDLLTAGFPCQPISQAGRRKVKADDRWIWPYIADAVRALRPRLLFLENVPPLLRPWRDEDGWWPAPVEEVIGDLAEAGYDAQWCSVRAADIGAPHRRERVFILATDASSAGADGAPQTLIDIPAWHDPLRRGVGDWWNATPERAKYAAAVERWAAIHGYPPTLHDDRGRLNPRFSEWMMGLPDGWVTDCDIPVTAQHKAIGNGVCPQQAALALSILTGCDTRTPAPPPALLPTPRTSDSNGPGSHGAGGPDLRTVCEWLNQ